MPLSEHIRILCGCLIQNDWVSRAKNLHQILHYAWAFLFRILFGWFSRMQLWATGDWQLHHGSAPTHDHISCRVFWRNIKSPRWLTPLHPRFDTLRLLAFPQTKITFEREEIPDHWWDSGKDDRAIRRTMWDPKVSTLKGTEASLSYVQCFLYLLQ